MTGLYSIQRLIYYRLDYEIFVYSRQHYISLCFLSFFTFSDLRRVSCIASKDTSYVQSAFFEALV